jgi:hypothetical protein
MRYQQLRRAISTQIDTTIQGLDIQLNRLRYRLERDPQASNRTTLTLKVENSSYLMKYTTATFGHPTVNELERDITKIMEGEFGFKRI